MGIKISALTEQTTPASTDLVPILSGGQTKKSTIINILNQIFSSATTWLVTHNSDGSHKIGVSASGTLASTVTGSGSDLSVADRATCVIPATGTYLILGQSMGGNGANGGYSQMQMEIRNNALSVLSVNINVSQGNSSLPTNPLFYVGSFMASDVVHLYVGLQRSAGNALIYGDNTYAKATQIIAIRIA